MPHALCIAIALLGCSTQAGDGQDDTGPGGATSSSDTGTPAAGSTGAVAEGSTSSGAPESSGGLASTTGQPDDASEASTTSGGDAVTEFCPPVLSPAAQPWLDAYDVHFDDRGSLRSALDDLESGTGHWGQTYTLRSLLLAYELTGDLDYLHELMWHGEFLAEIAGDQATWPTGVCGNSFEHSTVVIDARFLAPLLRAAWWMEHSRLADDAVPVIDGVDFEGATYGDVAASYVELAEAVLAGHEGDLRSIDAEEFGPESGNPSLYYRFPNSYDCVAGDVMPFNYANSAGTAYAELWRLSGDADALEHAQQLLAFWWNRTYAYEPSPGATRSRWYGYRGELAERFDPEDASHRPEDLGHADMTSSFADRMYALGLGLNATRMDQVAMASKRWVDRTVSTGGAPSYAITNDDSDGEWRDLFDHLPMSCHRGSILEDLATLSVENLANEDGSYPRSVVENIVEFAYYSEFSDTPSPCGPTCGDGVCNGAEDCVGCPDDCTCDCDSP